MSQDSAALLQAAHAAIRRGWRVIRLHSVDADGACSCRQGVRCVSAGKHPVDTAWQRAEEMTGADIQATWDTAEPPNLGIATGAPSGFWVLDVDVIKGGAESATRMLAGHPPLPATTVIETGSGGYHYYFRTPDFEVRNRQNLAGFKGIDVRGDGGQVVAPPSISGTGEYRTHSDVDPAPAPDWLLDMLRRPEPAPASPAPPAADLSDGERRRLHAYAARVRAAELARLTECADMATRDGSGYAGPPWNATTFAVSCSLLELAASDWNDYTPADAHADVTRSAPRDARFSDAEIGKCWGSATRKVTTGRPYPQASTDPLVNPRTSATVSAPEAAPAGGWGATPVSPWKIQSWDDMGNAARMVAHFGDKLRWMEQAGRWAVYADGRWALDEHRTAHSLAHRLIETLPATEAYAYDSDTRKGFLKWVKTQRMSTKIAAMLKETAAIPGLQAHHDDFDTDPFLLNCANGVLNLRTRELLPHDPSLMLMQQSPVSYRPDAPGQRFWAWLCQMQPNIDMRDYLGRIVGYSITGSIGEQAMFLHHGSGANGKSVFLELMSAILGDYGQVVPRDALTLTHHEQHPTAIARMIGKRFLQVAETAPGRRLNEEVVKGLTGGERQTARYMNRDYFDFRPSGKIHYVTNHLPRMTNAESTWRRMHLIGWRVRVPDLEKIPDLDKILVAEEAEGILAWAVDGCRAWLEQRPLQAPPLSKEDLRVYREDQDEFGEFIAECLVPVPGMFTPTGVLYGAYQAWCSRNGIYRAMQLRDLAASLRERGLEAHRSGTSRGFLGITVGVDANNRPVRADPLG